MPYSDTYDTDDGSGQAPLVPTFVDRAATASLLGYVADRLSPDRDLAAPSPLLDDPAARWLFSVATGLGSGELADAGEDLSSEADVTYRAFVGRYHSMPGGQASVRAQWHQLLAEMAQDNGTIAAPVED